MRLQREQLTTTCRFEPESSSLSVGLQDLQYWVAETLNSEPQEVGHILTLTSSEQVPLSIRFVPT